MTERIPQRIDHYRYTDKGVTLEGVISPQESEKDLLRLNESIIEPQGDIHYHLEFDKDRLDNRFVSGHVDAKVVMQCQRCMENFTLPLDCEVSIAFVHDDFEQKKAEDSGYDVFWLNKKELFDPRVLIEDELLLALPQFAMHPESDSETGCHIQLDFPADEQVTHAGTPDEGSGTEQDKQEDDNPFAILKQLKK